MLLIFYRFLPKSTACPNFIYFYDHNVYDEDDDRWRKRQMKTYTLLIVDDQADAAEQLRSGIEGISPGVFDIAVMNDVQAIQQIFHQIAFYTLNDRMIPVAYRLSQKAFSSFFNYAIVYKRTKDRSRHLNVSIKEALLYPVCFTI